MGGKEKTDVDMGYQMFAVMSLALVSLG